MPSAVSEQKTWLPAAAPTWSVVSTESFTGLKYENSSLNLPVFTGITHTGDVLAANASVGATWTRTGATTWLMSPDLAKAKISGVVNFNDGHTPSQIIQDKAQVWLALALWP